MNEIQGVPYKKSTQPGYNAKLYVESIQVIEKIIVGYGYNRFQKLEPETPIMRIFDKLTFSYGNSW